MRPRETRFSPYRSQSTHAALEKHKAPRSIASDVASVCGSEPHAQHPPPQTAIIRGPPFSPSRPPSRLSRPNRHGLGILLTRYCQTAIMKRLECLDGLRGLLAVYVMLSHMARLSGLNYLYFPPLWIRL